MNFRKFRGLAAVAITTSLVLAGCGSSDTPDKDTTSSAAPGVSGESYAVLASIKVDAPDANKAPASVKFDQPLGVTEASAKILSEGTGDVVKQGDVIKVNFVQFNGEDGTTNLDTYETGKSQTIIVGDPNIYPALMDSFKDQKVGTRVLFATPATEASQAAPAAPPILFVMEITDTASSEPSGEEVTPAEGLPTVSMKDGKPQISIPKDFVAGDKLIVQPLIKGTGDVVSDTAWVTANYTGWKASNGEPFDSSFDRNTPFQFSVQGGVIQGWMDGVKGQTVGSRLLLIIPKAMAYGGSPTHELAEEDLVFVVDIIAADQ